VHFADLVDFTRRSPPIAPAQVVQFQNELISTFDRLADRYRLEKSNTIGDAYMVAGVIGRHKFIYDLWGDTVNTASRMESQGVTGCIQVTARTWERLRDSYRFERRGSIQVKGKGRMVTYFLVDRSVPSA
jgi:adenylate cyclase